MGGTNRKSYDFLHLIEKSLYVLNKVSNRSIRQRCSVKRGVLKNFAKFTGKHLCQSIFLILKKRLWYMFSCEFCKIFKKFARPCHCCGSFPFLTIQTAMLAGMESLEGDI